MNIKYNTDRLPAVTASFKEILQRPLASIATTLTMSFAIFLVTLFYLLDKNADKLNDQWNTSADISLYIEKKVSDEETKTLIKSLQKDPLIANVEWIHPDNGMKTFVENTALGALLSSFKSNPLPSVVVIQPKVKQLPFAKATKLIEKLEQLPEVKTVKADIEWIKQSYHWLNLWSTLSAILVLALALNALLVVIGASHIVAKISAFKHNTHKLILQYQFAWYGLISSLLALFAIRIIIVALKAQGVSLINIGFGYSFFITIATMLLSFVSARIAGKN